MNELRRVENQARLANKQILVAAKKQLYQTSWLNIKVNQWKLWLMSCERKRAAARELHLHLFSCLSYLVGFFVLVRQFQHSCFWTFPLLFSMHVFHWELQLCLFNSTVRWCSLRTLKFFFPQSFFYSLFHSRYYHTCSGWKRMWEVKFRSIYVSSFAYKP